MVTGGVEQVDAAAVVFELEHGGRDGDASFFFHGHPVAGGGALFFLGGDAPGQADGTSVEKKLFGEGGLSRIGVGNDGKGATP